MALFGLFKNKLEKDHPLEWYFSSEGEKAFLRMKNGSHMDMVNYFTGFFKNFSTFEIWKNDLFFVQYVMLKLDNLEVRDVLGNYRPAKWANWPNLIDRKKNKFVDFLARLRHRIKDKNIWNVIATMSIQSDFDLDGKDAWLLNASFWKNPNIDKYEALLEYVQENHIKMPKIMDFLVM